MKQEDVTRLLVTGVKFSVKAHTLEGTPRFSVCIECFRGLNTEAVGESEDIAICEAAEKAIGFLEKEQSCKLDELCALQKQLTALRKISKT